VFKVEDEETEAGDGDGVRAGLKLSLPSVQMSGLRLGVSYTFTVSALNVAGASDASEPSNPALLSDPDVPIPCLAWQTQTSLSSSHTPRSLVAPSDERPHPLTRAQSRNVWKSLVSVVLGGQNLDDGNNSNEAETWVNMLVPLPTKTVLPNLDEVLQQSEPQFPGELIIEEDPAPPEQPKESEADKLMKQVDDLVEEKLGDSCPDIDVDLPRRRIFLKSMIHFWAGTADIKPQCYSTVAQLQLACRTVNEVVETMGMKPLHLRVEGHVHKTSNLKKCWRLSKERAFVITEKICDENNYPLHTVHPQGFGPSRPLGDKKLDRRVEVHVMDDIAMDQAGLIPGAPTNIEVRIDETTGKPTVSFGGPRERMAENGALASSSIEKYSIHTITSTVTGPTEVTESPAELPETLVPGRIYSFEITAENENGVGKPSHVEKMLFDGERLTQVHRYASAVANQQSSDGVHLPFIAGTRPECPSFYVAVRIVGKVGFGGKTQSLTGPVRSWNPVWNDELQFDLRGNQVMMRQLHFEVLEKDSFSSVGECYVKATPDLLRDSSPSWYSLFPAVAHRPHAGPNNVVGDLELHVTHDSPDVLSVRVLQARNISFGHSKLTMGRSKLRSVSALSSPKQTRPRRLPGPSSVLVAQRPPASRLLPSPSNRNKKIV